MTAVAGALGSVIGYVGAEVAEVSIFERLLWPQRFYNDLSPSSFLANVFLMPMGGPLHRAALETLDRFRENGLYRGTTRGHMLGTAFFEAMEVPYFNRSSRPDEEKKVRNGFWLKVLKNVDQGTIAVSPTKPDLEGHVVPQVRRAVQLLFLLDITAEHCFDFSNGKQRPAADIEVTEESISIRTVIGVVASELSAVAIAIAVGVWQRTYWLAVFFCVPLVLKLLSLVVSVRRESVSFTDPTPASSQHTSMMVKPGDSGPEGKMGDKITIRSETKNAAQSPQHIETAEKNATEFVHTPTEIFEIICPSLGFALIRGQPPHVLPFFRHYGHPLRKSNLDRAREICCIILVYAFVLYFPAGLISLLWMSPNTQYLWLAYQVFAITAMHVSRLFGLGAYGGIEKRIASVLQSGKTICLQSGNVRVRAKLKVEQVSSHALGLQRINEIVKNYSFRDSDKPLEV